MRKLCLIRDICRSIAEFENEFYIRHGLSLNEGIVLCTLRSGRLSSGEIAKEINFTCSNTSKLIKSIEKSGYITRNLGEEDKRQMYFTLTQAGLEKLSGIENDNIKFTGPLALLGKKD